MKSSLITLTEDIEIARHSWLHQPNQEALQQCHTALTNLCRRLHTFEQSAAAVYEKRWLKIANDLEPLLHCYNLSVRLQASASPEQLHKLAGPLSTLMLNPEQTVRKRFDSEKWRRLRGWWREFIDALEADHPYGRAHGNLPKAIHRLLKYRDNVFRDSTPKRWQKLRYASVELADIIGHQESDNSAQHQDLLIICQVLNSSLAQWHWLQAQLSLIKTLRKSPLLQGDNKSIALLDSQLDLVRAESHVLLEQCRDALVDLDSKV